MSARSGTAETDGELVQRIGRGDLDALARLYARYEPQLSRFCVRLTGNPHDAADLVQETFLRFLRRAPRLDPERISLPPYLFVIARHRFYEQRRGESHRAAPLEDDDAVEAPASEHDPELAVLVAEQREQVRHASVRLAPRQRMVLALREVEELPYSEIGGILGINANAVAQLLLRSRLRLRRELRLAQIHAPSLSPEVRAALPALCAYVDDELDEGDRERVVALLDRSGEARAVVAALEDASRAYRGVAFATLPAAAGWTAISAGAGSSGAAARPRIRRPRGPRSVAAGVAVTAAAAGLAAAAVVYVSSRPGGGGPARATTAAAPATTGAAPPAAGGGGQTQTQAAPGATTPATTPTAGTTPPASGPTATTPGGGSTSTATAPPASTAASSSGTTPSATTPPGGSSGGTTPPGGSTAGSVPGATPAAGLVIQGLQSTRGHRIAVTLANGGSARSAPAVLRVRAAGGQGWRRTVAGVDPGRSVVVLLPYGCRSPTDRITAGLAGAGQAGGARPAEAALAFDCGATAAGSTSRSPQRPDLVILELRPVGDRLEVTVANIGNAPSPPTQVTARTGANGTLVADVPGLPVGGSAAVAVPWPCAAPQDVVRSEVDAARSVAETTDRDNSLVRTVRFGCAPPP